MPSYEHDLSANQRPLAIAAGLGLLCIGMPLLVACPGGEGTPGDAGPTPSSFRIGEKIDESTCDGDIDCPPGYACRSGQCRQVDNDLDNDGFDTSADCDDNDPELHPAQAEVCDGVDNNCSGVVDEGVLNACGTCGAVPGEVCDLIDNDCDGIVDEDCSAGEAEEEEPNDGFINCQAIAIPPNEGDTTIISGVFDPPGDIDSYCFFVRPGTQLLIDLDSQVLGAATDGILQLFGANGAQLPGGYNDYHMGPDPLLDFTFAVEENVRLDVYNWEDDVGGPAYIYDLKVTAVSLVECVDQDDDGVSICDGDCRDDDVLVFPNQTEVCDGVDNNCDGVRDEACPDHSRVEQEPNNTLEQCEILMPPFTVKGVINPSRDSDTYCFFAAQDMKLGFDIDAKEGSDSLLNSKLSLWDISRPNNDLADNNDGIDPQSGYTAPSSDSYLEYRFMKPGIYAVRVQDEGFFEGGSRLTYELSGALLSAPACADADSDGVSTCEGDCEDSDPTVHFGAIEICDGQDNNCDGVSDFDTCTGDFDGDGTAGDDGDCSDTDPTIHPGATEVCDEIDNDCDGQIDEGTQNACGRCGFTPAERCGDGEDNDCDGSTDEADCASDGDADGYSPDQGDCNDGDAAVHPTAAEQCNGLDDNCDGLVDEYVKNSCGVCGEDPAESCDGLDNNCNGIIDDGVLNACGFCGPAPVEVCDGLDNDCDVEVDEGLLNACGECGAVPLEVCDGEDNDCDGQVDESCDHDVDGDGMTWREGDCDDGDDGVYFGAEELCGDLVDNDCDGVVNEPPCAVPQESEANNTIAQCDALLWPGRIDGVVAGTSDVDLYCFRVTVPGTKIGFDIDARPLGSPLDSLIEILSADGASIRVNNNGIDPQGGTLNVDSYVVHEFDEAGDYALKVSAQALANTTNPAFYQLHTQALGGCIDLDGDGMPRCDADCDDFNASIHPGAVDVCDGATVDNNCSGVKDELCWGDCLDDRYKGNHFFGSAAPLASGAYEDLYFCGNESADDFFKASLTNGQVVHVEIAFDHAEVDLTLRAYDPQRNVIIESAGVANNESVTFNVNADGVYYVEIEGPFGAVGAYEMNATITAGGAP